MHPAVGPPWGMADALPTHQAGDEGSDLASSYEVIALLVHSYLTALKFRLCGLTEDSLLPECEDLDPRLPPQWNAGFGSLSFVYKHKQSSMQFLFRIDRMGSKIEIRGLAIGHETIFRFERIVRDVIQSSKLPIRITMTPNGEDRSDLADKITNTFVSQDAVSGVIQDLKVKIVQKLIPKLQAEGYEETDDAEEAQQAQQAQSARLAEETARSERRAQEAQNRDRPFDAPPRPTLPYPQPNLLPDMARPRPGAPVGDFPPPTFEDEYEINRPPLRVGPLMPGQHPFNIGHDDLNPPGLGPHDPLRAPFSGGGFRQPGSSGMYPTFQDPMFGGRSAGDASGGAGYDPQAPPGARWDPYGPGGSPAFPGPGTFGGNPYGGGPGGGHII